MSIFTNTFTVIFHLRNNGLGNEKLPVYARITINKKRIELSVKQMMNPGDWNEKKGLAHPITEEYKQLNNYLENHSHLHIIANLVNNKGETIKDNWVGLRGKKAAQRLTSKYGLKEAVSKNLALTNLEALSEREANRYVIYQAILEKLPLSNSLEDLKEKLEGENIETLYKYKGQTNELQGISFKIGEYKYKGSEIDRKFSLKNLEKALLEHRMQKLLKPSQAHSQVKSLFEAKRHGMVTPKEQSESIIGKLLNAEQIDQSVPHHFQIKKYRQKKSRRQRL